MKETTLSSITTSDTVKLFNIWFNKDVVLVYHIYRPIHMKFLGEYSRLPKNRPASFFPLATYTDCPGIMHDIEDAIALIEDMQPIHSYDGFLDTSKPVMCEVAMMELEDNDGKDLNITEYDEIFAEQARKQEDEVDDELLMLLSDKCVKE